ncbi:hypothetical protein LOTGIDRAFT_170460 [Lottia gigantea]|uniref:Phospholipase A2-like domain-containing protein n=1 Tax=Lottia gigantea TaxID=225164 RepID=V3ZM61_LOTGI|nr:hypothetical protein LOTGIDRAFT_170460 [Lottia gigantea]ESO81916.1 hypothetical protein LOTGIDRAFT_170460 [Lottia gigantea]
MIVAHAPKTYFGSGDIQKSLGSLPGFPWAKYPGEKHLPGHNYTGPGTRLDLRLDENDKPKPGEEPVNRVDAAAFKHDILYRNKDINFRHEADKQMIIELENIPNPTFKKRMQRALIIKLLKAKMKLVGDRVRIFKYKSKFEKGYVGYWTNEIFIVDKVNTTSPPTYELIDQDKEQIIETKKPNTTAWISKAKPYFLDQIGDTLQGDLDMNNFSITNLKSPENDNDAIHKKYLREQINSIEVKVDSLFFRQDTSLSNKKFNARKVLQFINGTKNVETKELEINDENTKVNHLYEIKTSGKYIDRFRMLIIPDNEDQFILNDFDMLLETETPPSMNIIRNPEPEKKDISHYEFLRATDFEYVKLYFVINDVFTSIDIHILSQQSQKFLIRDDAYVNISIYIEKPYFSVHLNKINDSKEQISLVIIRVVINKHLAALSEVHLI